MQKKPPQALISEQYRPALSGLCGLKHAERRTSPENPPREPHELVSGPGVWFWSLCSVLVLMSRCPVLVSTTTFYIRNRTRAPLTGEDKPPSVPQWEPRHGRREQNKIKEKLHITTTETNTDVSSCISCKVYFIVFILFYGCK